MQRRAADAISSLILRISRVVYEGFLRLKTVKAPSGQKVKSLRWGEPEYEMRALRGEVSNTHVMIYFGR